MEKLHKIPLSKSEQKFPESGQTISLFIIIVIKNTDNIQNSGISEFAKIYTGKGEIL
jgi:hypothetical protein